MTDLNHPSSTKEDTPDMTLLKSKTAMPQESYDQEVKTASLLGVVVPTEKDILCCRGLTATEHPGNVLFRAIVRTYIPRYNSLYGDNASASLLYWEITQTLQREHGARYLRRQGDVWIIVDDEEARKKTAREVRKQQKLQQQREAQEAKKEEGSKQLEQTMKLSSGNKKPSAHAADKTIRKKPRGLWSFNAEISRIMGEESNKEDGEKQGRRGTSNKSTTTTAAAMTFRAGHQDHQHAREEQEQEQQEDGREEDGTTASTTSSSSSSSGGGSSDHEKWHPSNIMKPVPNHTKNNKKQQLFLKPHSVGEAPASRSVSMVLEAVEQVPPSSWSPASSGRRNFLALVSQNLPPDEGDEYSFSTRRRMMTRSPQHQQHFLMSGPSSTNSIGNDAYYYRHIDTMNGLHHGSRILQGERGGGGAGGVTSSTTVLSPRPAAATSYYHDHDEYQDDDRKAPSLRSKNVPSSSSAARGHDDHHHQHHLQGKQEQYIDERLPVADFFLE